MICPDRRAGFLESIPDCRAGARAQRAAGVGPDGQRRASGGGRQASPEGWNRLARRTGGWRRAWATGWRCSAGTSWGYRSWGLGCPRSAMNGALVGVGLAGASVSPGPLPQAALLDLRHHNGVGGPRRAQRDHALGRRHAGSARAEPAIAAGYRTFLPFRVVGGRLGPLGHPPNQYPRTHGPRGPNSGIDCAAYARRSAADPAPRSHGQTAFSLNRSRMTRWVVLLTVAGQALS